jgi:hypothetical protein
MPKKVRPLNESIVKVSQHFSGFMSAHYRAESIPLIILPRERFAVWQFSTARRR